MPATPSGWPYPSASDPVAQGAAAIQALATLLEANIQPIAPELRIPKSVRIRANNTTGPCFIQFDNPVTGRAWYWFQDDGGGFICGIYGGLNVITMNAAGAVNIMGQRVLRHHTPASDIVAEHIQGPGNPVPTYSIAFAVAFAAVPVVSGDRDNPFAITAISATGFTVNAGSSGYSGRWIAMGLG